MQSIEVIAETPDYLVLNKPSGLLVHPTQAEEPDTLAAWLVKNYKEVKKVGDDPKVRPGIVHRLDKDASGLMVVARTQEMFEKLKMQFKNRTVEKEYLALVHGKPAKDWEDIKFPIARGRTNDRMAARPQKDEPVEGEREAHTEFIVEKRFANCSLLRIFLHTGRMHQIRVHMLAYNHPLVGDPLYNQKKRKKNLDEKLGRLFLHSTKLAFEDLNGEKKTFESPLPEVLQTFVNNLK
jgi:23S rRNA pseudouridine1911/1915/1917 synthase